MTDLRQKIPNTALFINNVNTRRYYFKFKWEGIKGWYKEKEERGGYAFLLMMIFL